MLLFLIALDTSPHLGWSQVLRQRASADARIVAIDIQPMLCAVFIPPRSQRPRRPIEGVVVLRGDVTKRAAADAVVDALGE